MIELLKTLPEGQPVPAISLRQPWAGALAFFGKDVENRSNWPFKYRGPMIIHASATKAYIEDFDDFRKLAKADGIEDDELRVLDPTDPEHFSYELFEQGAIVAVANLVAVFGADDDVPEDHPVRESPWADNEAKYWLYFENVTPVEPVDYKGAVGLFKIPYSVAAGLRAVSAQEEAGDGSDEGGASGHGLS
jgi:hypothetical protein